MARIAGTSRAQTEDRIFRAALTCLANHGDKETTFQTIAARAGVSPALVVRYFGARTEIFPKVLSQVIAALRTEAAQSVSGGKTAREKLRAYFRSQIAFFRETPERARLYLMLYHFASYEPRYREICTDVKEVAVKRIASVLAEGESRGELTLREGELTARLIHSGLNGLLISLISTDQPLPDSVLLQRFEALIFQAISAEK